MEMLPQVEQFSWLEQHKTPKDMRDKAKWLKHRELGWDNTVRKYTPMYMKGFKPITFEPWTDDSVRFGEEQALGFDPWGTGEVWDTQKGKKDAQGIIFDSAMEYQTWLQKRRRLKSILQHHDEYRILRC